MKPAERVLKIFDTLVATTIRERGQTPMVEVWAHVFDLQSVKREHLEDEVAALLRALRQALDTTKEALLAVGVTIDMLEPGFSRLHAQASPGRLLQDWQGSRGNFVGPEVRLSLAWAAWAAPAAMEDEIPPEVLASLHKDLDSLENDAKAEGVSPYIRDLILKNVGALRAGLRLYGVNGLGAVAEALSSTTGTLVAAKTKVGEELRSGNEPTRTVAGRLKGLIDKVVKTADTVEKVDKGVKAGTHLYSAASEAIAAIGQNFPSLPSS